MKKRTLTVTVLLIVLALCTVQTYAQTPQGFSYQAVVRDGSGVPIASQYVGLRITLEDALHASYYTETQRPQTNAQGVLSVTIGAGDRVGNKLFVDIPWKNGDVFIKLEIDPAGGTSYAAMGVPSKLQSVPYALYSPNEIANGSTGQTLYHSGTAWTPSSVLVNNGTNIGIGSAMFTPSQKLDVNGAVRLRDLLYDYNNLSGSTNQILTRSTSGVLWQSPSGIGVPSGTGLNNQLAVWSGTNSIKGITNLTWGTNFQVISIPTAGTDDPIMEVKNKNGMVVFAVYQSGVRMYVDGLGAKGAKGGFAVGGLTSKSSSEYFLITPDSARIRLKDPVTKGAKGGFAVGGLTSKGAANSYLQLMPDNYFIGQDAGKSIKDGKYNIFLGYQAGSNTVGLQSNEEPTLGDNNIFLGYRSGFANVNGEQNIYVGAFSGENNVNGESNTFVGAQSGRYNTGYGNTYLGAQTGSQAQVNNSGFKNTYIGHWSGYNNTTGNGNVFIGRECGMNNTTGYNNVYIGHLAGNNNTGGYGNVFIGPFAGWYSNQSNTLVINNSGDAQASIPTNSLIYGDFSAKTLRFNANVGIGNISSTAYGLVVNGGSNSSYSAYFYKGAYATGSFISGSDKRWKKNINTIENALDKVTRLRGVTYFWDVENNPDKAFDTKRQIGVIAQEVEEIIPELVITDEQGFKGVNYPQFSAILIEAIKEQQKKIGKLEEKVKEIDALKAELEAIKALLKK